MVFPCGIATRWRAQVLGAKSQRSLAPSATGRSHCWALDCLGMWCILSANGLLEATNSPPGRRGHG